MLRFYIHGLNLYRYVAVVSVTRGIDETFKFINECNMDLEYDNGIHYAYFNQMMNLENRLDDLVRVKNTEDPDAGWVLMLWDDFAFCSENKTKRYSFAIEPGLLEMAKSANINISRAARSGIVEAIYADYMRKVQGDE